MKDKDDERGKLCTTRPGYNEVTSTVVCNGDGGGSGEDPEQRQRAFGRGDGRQSRSEIGGGLRLHSDRLVRDGWYGKRAGRAVVTEVLDMGSE